MKRKFKNIIIFFLGFFLISCEENISSEDLDIYKNLMDVRLGHLGNAIIMQGRLLDAFNLSNERADEDHFKEAEEIIKSHLKSFGRSDELRKMDTSMATISKNVGGVTTFYTGMIYGPKTLTFIDDPTYSPASGHSNRFLSGIVGSFTFDIYSNTTYIKKFF